MEIEVLVTVAILMKAEDPVVQRRDHSDDG